jgi:hypothetical protein
LHQRHATGRLGENSRCPIVYVYPDHVPTGGEGPPPCVLNLFHVRTALACIRLYVPEGAEEVKVAYLDMNDTLAGTDCIGDSCVRVVRGPPPNGNCFFFVLRGKEDFSQMMRRRYGLNVVKVSEFAFDDAWVRDIWVAEELARQLRQADMLPVRVESGG